MNFFSILYLWYLTIPCLEASVSNLKLSQIFHFQHLQTLVPITHRNILSHTRARFVTLVSKIKYLETWYLIGQEESIHLNLRMQWKFRENRENSRVIQKNKWNEATKNGKRAQNGGCHDYEVFSHITYSHPRYWRTNVEQWRQNWQEVSERKLNNDYRIRIKWKH